MFGVYPCCRAAGVFCCGFSRFKARNQLTAIYSSAYGFEQLFGVSKQCLHGSPWLPPCPWEVPTCDMWLTFSAGEVQVGISKGTSPAQEVRVWISEGTPFCQGGTHMSRVGTSLAKGGTPGNPVLRFPTRGCWHVDAGMVIFQPRCWGFVEGVYIFELECSRRVGWVNISPTGMSCLRTWFWFVRRGCTLAGGCLRVSGCWNLTSGYGHRLLCTEKSEPGRRHLFSFARRFAPVRRYLL